ncbi:phage tail protein [Pseudomonas sp. zfem003]|uniref:phage tail protein n=1 Tax=Pseudomonas sp. zfem003 TaxID=3078198 RepID=UPI002927715B|nr:phage tail protein [Pseudomonas sp. zfem003]MDU9395408.1 phage tail protein [Pseudomonas sp. zfem003]
MSQTYYAILTALGEAKLANAAALDQPLQISKMAVGDGNGSLPTPDRTQTALVRETYRANLNTLQVDPANASQVIAELVIPETVGGWWIRELGLYDAAGILVAVANCPPSYKPQLAEGSGRTQVLRMVLVVSSTSAVELKIDPSVVLATRAYVQITVDALRADLVSAIGQAVADTTNTLMPQINAKLPLVGGNVSGFVNFNRSITGGYGTTTGTGNAWAAPIWAMGPGYSGGAAGTTFSPAGLYGIAWYRSGAYGEGAYLYVNGTAVGAMGQTGIFTVGGFHGKGTGLTEIPPAAISPVSIHGTAESYSVTLPGGLILKFGTFSRATVFSEGELITITFPDAFPSSCLWGGAMPVNTSGTANAESMYLRKSMTKTNAVIMVEHVTSGGMNGKEFAWFFVGK